MLTSYAGPICEGIECVPFVIFVVLYITVPFIVGAALLTGLTLLAIKLVNRRHSQPLSTRISVVIVVIVLLLAGAVCSAAWQLPKSKYWQDKKFSKNKSLIMQRSLLLPTALARTNTRVEVPLGDPTGYAFKSTFIESSRELEVKQTRSTGILNKPPAYFSCGEFPAQQIKYCRISTTQSLSPLYWVTVGEDSVELFFSRGFSEPERIDVIKSLKPFPLNDLPNTIFVQSSYL